MNHRVLNASVRRTAMSLVVAAVLGVVASPALAQAPAVALAPDWNQWRGPNRDGISSESQWTQQLGPTEPRKAWSMNVGVGYSTVSVFKDRVFTSGWRDGKDSIYAIDANSGKVIWTYSYAAPKWDRMHEGGPASTPAVDETGVYTISRDGVMYALNPETGSVIWTKDLRSEFRVQPPEWGFSGSPLILGDRIAVDMGVIAMLDKKTGNAIWRTKNYEPAYSSPVAMTLGGQLALACFPKSGLVVVAQADGKELASYRWDTSYGVNAATPIVQGNQIFISSGYNKGSALIDVTGGAAKVLWQSREMRNQMPTCVLHEGFLYGFDEGRLTCIDFKTGQTRWVERGLGQGALMLAGGRLIIASERGQLVIAEASPNGFKSLGRWSVLPKNTWTVPVLNHGRLYMRDAEGHLVCLDMRG